MSAIQALILLAVSLALCTAAMSVMSRAVRREHRDRIDAGANAENEPGCP